MREDIKGLKASVDAIAKDQALGVERRASMQRSADSIHARLDGHGRDLDRMLAWQNRADWALVLARWALGASLVSLVAVALQVLATVGHAINDQVDVTGGGSCQWGSRRRPMPTGSRVRCQPRLKWRADRSRALGCQTRRRHPNRAAPAVRRLEVTNWAP